MTDNSELVKNFAALFAGRTDAYGSWEGGCIKQPVTQGSFTKHLWGQEYIGIYPMMDDSTVWWGCSDIDVNDIDQARNIQLALKLKLIESWVERTESSVDFPEPDSPTTATTSPSWISSDTSRQPVRMP